MPVHKRFIAHIDMDAFFAAVEQRDCPSLKGKPVVVGADPKGGRGRGVVSTCSYEARKYGIHSAMPISKAYKLCPNAVFLPGNGKKYRRVSDKIFRIFYDFTPDIEPISIDEAFLDITKSYHLFGTPKETCQRIKDRIKVEIGLTASIGIASNKMVAKIASDHCKPDGLLEVKKDELLDFLWPLPVERLWGVGLKSTATLNKIGIKTIGELAKTSVDELNDKFGEMGIHMHNLANGIDEREVELDDETKSVSNEHTFETDTADKDKICHALLFLSEKVSRRLRKYKLKGKTITLKIRLKGFHTYTRAYTMHEKTNFADTIYQEVKKLFDAFYKDGSKVRLVGVRVSNFTEKYVAESLFINKEADRKEKIHRALDLIKDKFGEASITRGLRKDID